MDEPHSKPRVAFIHELPTPYTTPLVALLAEEEDLEVEVFFCVATERGRAWEVPERLPKNAEIMPGVALPLSNRGLTLKFNPAIWARLSRGRFDAVVISGYVHPTMLLAMLWCRLHEVPYILVSESHLLRRRSRWKAWLKERLLPPLIGGADAWLATGSNSRDYLLHYGADARRTFFFPNTIDVDHFEREMARLQPERTALRARFGIPPEATFFLFVGRFVPQKGLSDLIEAFSRISPDGEAWLLLVGSGPLQAEIEGRIEGNERVILPGFVQAEALPPFYALSDVFVLPSHAEPWGVVVNEALACGLPVIASDQVGAARDLIHPGENGIVFPTGDTAALTDALERLLHDRDLLAQMRPRCVEIVRDWGYPLKIRSLREAVATVLGSPPLPSSRGSIFS